MSQKCQVASPQSVFRLCKLVVRRHMVVNRPSGELRQNRGLAPQRLLSPAGMHKQRTAPSALPLSRYPLGAKSNI